MVIARHAAQKLHARCRHCLQSLLTRVHGLADRTHLARSRSCQPNSQALERPFAQCSLLATPVYPGSQRVDL